MWPKSFQQECSKYRRRTEAGGNREELLVDLETDKKDKFEVRAVDQRKGKRK